MKILYDQLRICCVTPRQELVNLLIHEHKCTLFHEVKNPERYYLYKDNKSSVLGVAHLDSHGENKYQSFFSLLPHPLGERLYTPTLDDRLGVYTLLYHLPALDIKLDWLFTIDEEKGNSTACLYPTTKYKKNKWMVSFDRTGDDVVIYDYTSSELRTLLTEAGFKMGVGSYSCISELEDLQIKGFNVGVGYYDYHGNYAYFNIKEYQQNIVHFQTFFQKYKNTALPHTARPSVILPFETYDWKKHTWNRDRNDNYFSNFRKPHESEKIYLRLEEDGEAPKNLNGKEDTVECWKCGRKSTLSLLPEKCQYCNADFSYLPIVETLLSGVPLIL